MDEFMVGWFAGVIVVTILVSTFFTPDNRIISGKKIKIDNAVYECKKTQELDLK